MSRQISCPRCSQLVGSHIKVCSECGVDLAIAAVLAEQQVGLQDRSKPTRPVTPEILVPKLGELLVDKGCFCQLS